ncbi:MAG: bifunctional folylpolyglutamate synthase/dihydrofolate synthase [Chloroflexi bacterium]|nr:bifunctional folylpolyglutamate synthase/dihydrofolate synthase [Chloroflexota bacterium]
MSLNDPTRFERVSCGSRRIAFGGEGASIKTPPTPAVVGSRPNPFPSSGYWLQFHPMKNDAPNTDAPLEKDAYGQALTYLYSLINFEMRPHDRYMTSKLDSTRPQRLMNFLGNPHNKFPSIHIAGTKGKGSVAAMCAASLRAAGYRVGLYTSPHVQEFRERIRILTPEDEDGRIAEDDFVALMEELKTAVAAIEGLTWFEVVNGIAFQYFARQNVDIAVVEVGLGGLRDSTNVITPLVSVITSLSIDHIAYLGDTLPEIAQKKGGIIKPGIPVVTAPQKPEALEPLLEIAVEKESPISVVGQNWQFEGANRQLTITHAPPSFLKPHTSFTLSLSGLHQVENAMVALAALSVAQPHFPNLTLDAVRTGLATAAWHGRLQTIHQSDTTPDVLVDCAHNVYSAAALRRALVHDYDYENLWLIYGASAGKDISGMLAELLSLTQGAVATISTHPRAKDPAEIVWLAAELGYSIQSSATVAEAVVNTWRQAGPNDLICVTGSVFVVGDLLNQWENLRLELLAISAEKTND